MPRRDYTNGELIELLQEFADELGETPTLDQIQDADHMPSRSTYANRFGSYREACREAGIPPNQRGGEYPREALIKALLNWVREHGELPSETDYKDDDDLPSQHTFSRRFGSTHEAYAEAMLWSSQTSVEVSEYSGTETMELDPGDGVEIRHDTAVVSIRNNY